MIEVLSPQLIVQTRYKYMTHLKLLHAGLNFCCQTIFYSGFVLFVPALCACYVM